GRLGRRGSPDRERLAELRVRQGRLRRAEEGRQRRRQAVDELEHRRELEGLSSTRARLRLLSRAGGPIRSVPCRRRLSTPASAFSPGCAMASIDLAMQFSSANPLAHFDELRKMIQKQPQRSDLRVFLFQLYCVQGEWAKAATQLDVLLELDPSAKPMVQTY